MTVTVLPVPSVSGGVSQQPALQASPDKWKDILNFTPLPEVGLVKRPGTDHQRESIYPTLPPHTMMIPIDLGDQEKYIATISNWDIQVFYRNGVEIPVKKVTRDSAGVPSAGADPEFEYLNLRRASFLGQQDIAGVYDKFLGESLTTNGTPQYVKNAWVGATDADDTAEANGPDAPLGFQVGHATAKTMATIKLVAGSALGSLSTAIVGDLTEAIWKQSIFVNTDLTGTGVSENFDVIGLAFQAPGSSDTVSVLWDFAGAYTTKPTVSQNTQGLTVVTEVLTDLGPNFFRLGVIFDPEQYTAPVSGAINAFILMNNGDSGSVSGMNAWGHLVTTGGDKDIIPDYQYEPESLRFVAAGATTFFANPRVSPQMDSTVKSTAFTDVYAETLDFDGAGSEGNKAVADSGFIHIIKATAQSQYLLKVLVTNGSITRELNGIVGPFGAGTNTDTDDIADEMVTDLNGDADNTDGGSSGYKVLIADTDGSVVRLRTKNDTGDTGVWTIKEISTNDGSGGSDMKSFYNEVDDISDLPLFCHHDTRIILKNPSDPLDEIAAVQTFLRFVCNNPTVDVFGTGYWQEGTDYDVYTTIDPTLAPQVLTRRQDDASGTVTGDENAIYFEWGPHTWNTRDVGDDDSAALPSFITPVDEEGLVDRFINAIGFHKNRLVIASGLNISYSEAARYGNFFRTTIQSLPDGDRIDVASTSPLASPIFGMAAIGSRLFFQAKLALMAEAQSEILSPRTIGIDVVLAEGAGELSIPKPAFTGFFYAQGGKVFDRITFLGTGTGGGLQPIDVTSEVPRYLRADVATMAWSPEYRALFVLSRKERDKLRVLRFSPGRGGTFQLSWSTWDFDGANIESFGVLGEDLFLLIDRDKGLNLESIPLDIDFREVGADWGIYMDRRITEFRLTTAMSYVGSTVDETTITLPYDIETGDAAKMIVVERDTDTAATFGVQKTVNSTSVVTPGSHTVVVSGDVTAKQLYIGRLFAASARPLRPVVRDPASQGGVFVPVANDTLVMQGRVLLNQSAYLDIKSTPSGPAAITANALDDEATTGVVLRDRHYEFGVHERAADMIVDFLSEDQKPTNISGLEWVVRTPVLGSRASF